MGAPCAEDEIPLPGKNGIAVINNTSISATRLIMRVLRRLAARRMEEFFVISRCA
jgi:hypothetical protein